MPLTARAASSRAALLVALLVFTAACGSETSTSTAPSPIARCAITLNASDVTVPATGGSGAVSVTATRDCLWSASVEGHWLSVKSGASGQGEGIVEFTAIANADPQTRTGAILVNGSRAQITQSAGECAFSLASSSADFAPDGGTARIDLRASSQLCSWSATADSPWIEIRSGASGRGSAAVTIAVAATAGPPRAGTVTIAGQRFSVTQSQGCTYAIDRTAHASSSSGGPGSIAVTTAPGCPWTAASNAEWITVSPAAGSGPGPVTFSVAPTQGPERTGSAVIAGHLFTITQSPGCAFQVAPATHSIPASGGTANISVTTAAGCSWSAASNASWITIQGPMSGNGPGTLMFAVAATAGAVRSGTVMVAGQLITVSQTQGCTYSISPQSESLPSSGGTGKVTVTAGDGCNWTASSSASWVTITAGSTGTGNGEVQYSVAATPGPARSATMTIAGQTFTINQGQGCTYRLQPTSVDIDDDGGQRSFDVQAGSGCAWTASTATSWITINSGASGTGNGTVRFTVAANSGPGRSGTLTAGDQTFTVNQQVGCSFALSSETFNAPAEGGTGSVNVTAAGGCAWVATSNAPWLTVTSGASGSGNGSVGFSVAANTGGARSGTLTIAGRTFTIHQGGACSYEINPTQQGMPGSGGTVDVAVTTSGGCAWTATSNASWISVTSGASGTGAGTVRLTVEPNGSNESRTGTVTIAGRTFTVQQESNRCAYTISPTSRSMPAAGGTTTTEVSAQGSCSWTATSNAPWITVTSSASDKGNGTVQMSVQANSGAPRSGTVTIAGHTFTMNQEGGCTFGVAPETIGAPAGGATARVEVTTAAGCAWTASSNAPWITITSGASGSGNGAVDLAIAANSGPARSGTVTVAGRTVTVIQESGCSVAIAPTTQTVPAAGGTGSISVTAGGGCTWNAVSSAAWVVVTSGASGSGDGVVQFTVDPNSTGAPRSATIAIGSQTFTVNQQ